MKTDNSHFEEKVQLRIDIVSNMESPRILECYSGQGFIWDEVIKRTGKNISILRIEKEKKKGNKIYLQGDNIKYLLSLDLGKFNVIDLDAYGIPYEQINILFDRKFKGVVIVTAIQSMLGNLPHGMLKQLGYTENMINKIPTLFSRDGFEKLKSYLYKNQIRTVEGYFLGKKNYFYFNI